MRSRISSIFLTLLFGFVGGAILYTLTMPLPWIFGSLLTVAALSLWGRLTLVIPTQFRQAMLAVLGVLLGSGFQPHSGYHLGQWTYSLIAVVALVLTQITFGQVLLHFLMRKNYNFPTRYFGGTPGGMLEMSMMARDRGGDDRAVMVLHTLRIILIVALVPLYFRIFEGYKSSSANAATGGLLDLDLLDATLLAAAALFGNYIGRKVRIPAYALMGPFVFSAVLHYFGFTSARPPFALVVFAQIVVGSSLGTRFSGYSMKRIKKLFFTSFCMSLALIGLAVGFAALIWHYTGLPFYGLMLAFVPGGMIEMSLIALALNIDVGFVTTHAIFRALLSVSLAPVLYAVFIKVRNMTHGK